MFCNSNEFVRGRAFNFTVRNEVVLLKTNGMQDTKKIRIYLLLAITLRQFSLFWHRRLVSYSLLAHMTTIDS